jgi:hypothetical protein
VRSLDDEGLAGDQVAEVVGHRNRLGWVSGMTSPHDRIVAPAGARSRQWNALVNAWRHGERAPPAADQGVLRARMAPARENVPRGHAMRMRSSRR